MAFYSLSNINIKVFEVKKLIWSNHITAIILFITRKIVIIDKKKIGNSSTKQKY